MTRGAHRPILAVVIAALLLLLVSPSALAVVGGKRVSLHAHPAVVALADACTATLVRPDRLMTAGHCASFVVPGVTTVRFGSPRQRYVATRVARHPRFRYQLPGIPAEPARDVAIVELDRPVEGVVPLSVSGRVVGAGTRVTIVGYGTGSAAHPERFGVLREASLVVYGVGTCRRLIERALRGQGRQFRGADMLCTGDPEGRRPYASGCNGDSGGPLLHRTSSGTVVVGIDSWGIACGEKDGDPEVFARMSREREFILSRAPKWAPGRIREPWDPPETSASRR